MRATKILLLFPVALIFAIGLATIYTRVRERLGKESSIDITGLNYVVIADGAHSKTRIIRIAENGQTLVQVSDDAGNQFDITFGSGVVATSRMIKKTDFTYFYHDRDGDGMPELRSRLDPKTGASIHERSAPPQWTAIAPKAK